MSAHRQSRLQRRATRASVSRTVVRAALIAAALLVAVPVLDAGAHYKPVGKDCGVVVFTPQSDDASSDIRARGTSCRTARRIVKSWERGNRSPLRFRCRARAHEGNDLAHQDVKCTRTGKRVTFAAY
jgi:hypothetical protein